MMAISSFDTHKFVRRMEAAGLTLEQAEAQAEVLNEAFIVNLEMLVTKDYFESRLQIRFAEQDARWEKRFAEQDAKWDKRFNESEAAAEVRFARLEATIDSRFAQQDAKISANNRLFLWTQAIVVTVVLIPYLERLMAL